MTVFRLPEGGVAESELLAVKNLLEANGILTVTVGDSPMPNFSDEIRVAAEDAEAARKVIADALAAGPQGAAEAEAETE